MNSLSLVLQASNGSELVGIAVAIAFMVALIAGAVLLILKAYRARADDEELRSRVAALEREVESLNERLERE